jgi:hypothetical protein
VEVLRKLKIYDPEKGLSHIGIFSREEFTPLSTNEGDWFIL